MSELTLSFFKNIFWSKNKVNCPTQLRNFRYKGGGKKPNATLDPLSETALAAFHFENERDQEGGHFKFTRSQRIGKFVEIRGWEGRCCVGVSRRIVVVSRENLAPDKFLLS